MSRVITANIGEKIEVRNTDGELMGFFYFNPADVDLARRCGIVSNELEKLVGEMNENNDLEQIEKINKGILDQTAFLLGEKAADTLFKYASPISVTPDGSLFAVYIFDIIFNFIKNELDDRSAKIEERIAGYTEKYMK